ncbi:MAG: DUF2111 domain-containing protein [Methanocella sp.]
MDRITITADATADDLASIAMCVHHLFAGLPVTARSRDRPGVQIENGKVESRVYTGPMLEQSIRENRVVKGRPESGAYKGIPVIIAPIMLGNTAIAAIGVVDTLGSLDIKAFMDQYSAIEKQVSGR